MINNQPAAPYRGGVTPEYIRACLEAGAATLGLPMVDKEVWPAWQWCLRIYLLAIAGRIVIPVIDYARSDGPFGWLNPTEPEEPREVAYVPEPKELEFLEGVIINEHAVPSSYSEFLLTEFAEPMAERLRSARG